jgi:AcrR family transcriptional regulator
MSARRTHSTATIRRRHRAPPGLPTLETSRARIHLAALQLFARYGYDGTSLQMIADAVGLHKSTLFHHYRGKLDVAAEAFEAATARVADCIRPLAAEAAPTLEGFFAVSDALVDHFSEEPEAARMIVWMMTAPRDSALNLHIGRDEAHPVVIIFTTLWAWIDRARRADVIRPVNIRQTIFNLVGLVVFYPAAAEASYLSGDEPFSAKARRIRKEELRLALRGMLEPR